MTINLESQTFKPSLLSAVVLTAAMVASGNAASATLGTGGASKDQALSLTESTYTTPSKISGWYSVPNDANVQINGQWSVSASNSASFIGNGGLL